MRTSMPAVVLTAALIGPVFAGDDNSPAVSKGATTVDVNTVFGRYGFSSSPHVTLSSCNVELTRNQKMFIENIDELKKIGSLNRELSQTTINSKPNLLNPERGASKTSLAAVGDLRGHSDSTPYDSTRARPSVAHALATELPLFHAEAARRKAA